MSIWESEVETAGTSAAQEIPRGLLGYMWCKETGREMEEEEPQMPGGCHRPSCR